jgi:hypothetical protein
METWMDHSAPHRAIGRDSGSGSIESDPESMTLEQLDEAFQSGAIDVTTLVRLQCIGDSAPASSPPSPSRFVHAERRSAGALLGAAAVAASDAWSAPSERAAGHGQLVAGRRRRGIWVKAIAVGLLIGAVAGALIASEVRQLPRQDFGSQPPTPEPSQPKPAPGVVPRGGTLARPEVEVARRPPARTIDRRKSELAVAVSNALGGRRAMVRRRFGQRQ